MTFSDIIDNVLEAGSTTGGQIKRGANALRKMDRRDYLAKIGLEPKRSTLGIVLPALGFLGAGILAGIGFGMLFAPKRGAELREDLTEQVKGVVARGKREIESAGAHLEESSPVI